VRVRIRVAQLPQIRIELIVALFVLLGLRFCPAIGYVRYHQALYGLDLFFELSELLGFHKFPYGVCRQERLTRLVALLPYPSSESAKSPGTAPAPIRDPR
jgi:hypothetical protein